MASLTMFTSDANGIREHGGFDPSPPAAMVPPLFSCVLPGSRSVLVSLPATAFAIIVNPSGATATGCSLSPVTGLPADFLYQTTDPLTNTLTGTPNTPVTIAPEASQSFLFAFTPMAAFPPTEVELQFDCSHTDAAPTFVGLNTLLLSASDTPTPDVAALAATLRAARPARRGPPGGTFGANTPTLAI
jgi:hypothetical protein